jgi:hypothetical protein
LEVVYTGRNSNDSDAKLIHRGKEFGCLEVTRHDNNEVIKTGTILSNLESPFMFRFPEVLRAGN